MTPDERIRELCAQLLRVQHPAVFETVVAELGKAIDEHTRESQRGDIPLLDLKPLVPSLAQN